MSSFEATPSTTTTPCVPLTMYERRLINGAMSRPEVMELGVCAAEMARARARPRSPAFAGAVTETRLRRIHYSAVAHRLAPDDRRRDSSQPNWIPSPWWTAPVVDSETPTAIEVLVSAESLSPLTPVFRRLCTSFRDDAVTHHLFIFGYIKKHDAKSARHRAEYEEMERRRDAFTEPNTIPMVDDRLTSAGCAWRPSTPGTSATNMDMRLVHGSYDGVTMIDADGNPVLDEEEMEEQLAWWAQWEEDRGA
ncbi:hypothetical protein CPLU01_12906 [Colletotrichum plurivorum]|uniref:Uncharacterized protein n=1 Tax=Colletotrichum plurivorum TaxID=2175906 RepID=A0A8H6JV11_9PEZI|nr:hypothetical protein CPLU01_12906 [Colletotrichum plurivorum]